jgi:hypothetical protein
VYGSKSGLTKTFEGGSILQTPGPYNFDKQLEPSGQTLHGMRESKPMDNKKAALMGEAPIVNQS